MKHKAYPAYKDSGIEWLSKLPSHWDADRLKYSIDTRLSNIDKHSVEGEPDVLLCNYVDVYKNERIDASIDFMRATASPAQIERLGLRKGDVIITKDSEDPKDIGVPALVVDVVPGLVCGYHLALLRPRQQTHGAFIHYLFKSEYVTATFETEATGMTRYALGKYSIENLRIPLPPLAEQLAIAAFLDRETTKIDTLISKQERLVDLLQEKRQATISHAVTKGLNRNAPMRDSGVEWLGEVPRHWTVMSIKWLSPVQRGASPRPIDDPKYFDEDGEYAWVRIADVSASDGHLRDTTQRLSVFGSSLSVKIHPGELFVSIAGTVGKPCISEIKACIHDGFVYFPMLNIRPEFLFRIFEAGTCYLGLGKMGTQLNLNTDTIGSIRIAVPPAAEMGKILEYIDIETAKIDSLIEKCRLSINLLRERRSALISAAVTGKIDVRDEAAGEAA